MQLAPLFAFLLVLAGLSACNGEDTGVAPTGSTDDESSADALSSLDGQLAGEEDLLSTDVSGAAGGQGDLLDDTQPANTAAPPVQTGENVDDDTELNRTVESCILASQEALMDSCSVELFPAEVPLLPSDLLVKVLAQDGTLIADWTQNGVGACSAPTSGNDVAPDAGAAEASARNVGELGDTASDGGRLEPRRADTAEASADTDARWSLLQASASTSLALCKPSCQVLRSGANRSLQVCMLAGVARPAVK